MLSWIPIVGPIIQGIVSIFTKKMDTTVQITKIQRDADVQEAQVSQQIIHDTSDDIALRFMRDLAVFPVVAWSALIGWDTIIAYQPWAKSWMWGVPNYPASVGYLPYAVIVFLFGNIGLNIWKRR